MKTFIQSVNEAVRLPAENPIEIPPRKIAGHIFGKEQIERQEPAAQPK